MRATLVSSLCSKSVQLLAADAAGIVICIANSLARRRQPDLRTNRWGQHTSPTWIVSSSSANLGLAGLGTELESTYLDAEISFALTMQSTRASRKTPGSTG